MTPSTTTTESSFLAAALEERLIDPALAAELLLQLEAGEQAMPVDVQLVAKGVITPKQRAELLDTVKQVGDGGESTRQIRPSAADGESQHGPAPASPASTGAGRATAADDKTQRGRDSAPDSVDTTFVWEHEHARGGLGAVWQGWDATVERTVALKMLLPHAAKSRRMRERFVNEGRITGQLEHPGIVPVYAMGESEQGPFYAMRMLHGRTLSEMFRELHELKHGTAEHRVAQHAALRAFASVCSTIAFAHHERVIHRDLKPSNVMLGDFGEVLVVDWGLAKRLPDEQEDVGTRVAGSVDRKSMDDASVRGSRASRGGSTSRPRGAQSGSRTMDGEVLGTPLYMSPEQAAGRTNLTPASDIFSLGVILYELLSGSKAFRAADTEAILAKVREAQFVPLSTFRHVPKPLRAICEKAMQATPEQRYATAGDLANDIHGFLAGDPVGVHRESIAERCLRWIRHHRSLATVIASAGVLLCVVSLTAALLIDQSRRQESTAKQQAIAAHLAEKEAHRRQKEASEWALAQIEDTRKAADAWLIDWSGDIQFYPGLQPVRAELLQRAIAHYESTIESADGHQQPEVMLETCRSLIRLGDVRRLAGRDDAASAYESVLSKLNALDQPDTEGQQWELRLRAELGLALSALAADSNADHDAAIQQITDAMQVAGPTAAPDQLALLASAWHSLARLHLQADPAVPTAADKAFANAQRKLALLDSPEPRHHAALTNVLMDRARLASDDERWADACRYYSLATEAFERQTSADSMRPDRWETWALCELLHGVAEEQRGRNEQARRHYEASLNHYRTTLECLYGDAYLNENIAVARANLARQIRETQPTAAAEHLLAARDELIGLIQRDGADPVWMQQLKQCLQELVKLQSELPPAEGRKNQQLLDSL